MGYSYSNKKNLIKYGTVFVFKIKNRFKSLMSGSQIHVDVERTKCKIQDGDNYWKK